jgi:hypothetical protein
MSIITRFFEQPFPVEVQEIEELEKFEILPGGRGRRLQERHIRPKATPSICGIAGGKTLVYSADTALTK